MGFVNARKKAGYTQGEVAKALNITDSAVNQWESGKTRPRAGLLVRLAKLYNCTIDDLLCAEEAEERKN